MILQALNDYYERLRADPDQEVSDFGFSYEKLSFSLVLSEHGAVIQVRDLRRFEGRRVFPRPAVVPKLPKERSGKNAPSYFMWDKSKYVLGCELDNDGKEDYYKNQFYSFAEVHHEILDANKDVGAKALLSFIDQRIFGQIPEWATKDLLSTGFIAFELDGENGFLHERQEIKDSWQIYLRENQSEVRGQCLITGKKYCPIPRSHPQMKNVHGAQSSGAALVSFNAPAFGSYGKGISNLNAPASEQAAFAYTTALNTLLASGSRRKVQIGDATVVFWTDVPVAAEDFFGLAVGGKESEDQNMTKEIEQHLRAVVKGHYPHELGKRDTAFYVLGLSPNAARLSVRFWYVGTVGTMAENIGAHYKALSLQRSFENDPEYPRPWWLLKELAPQRDSRHIPPLLAGQFVRAIVHNQLYPRTLLTTVMGRIRADKQVNYLRACIIKAYLTRNARKEIAMGLDKENTDIGYRLGRLFAIVEYIQNDAVPGANATVRDRFFGAAAATPRRIFPVILKNAQHGLAKIRKEKPGWAVTLDKSLQDILASVEPQKGFPATMPLEKQGMFVLGYYHQRQDLYTKHEDKTEE
ncbi:type I-C CRISPR-associated protein Cas8c/Csd1 [Desulfovermiculus halophilus]|uniref:type I-C CRISPR-associated protein Cas8c/Csd1 n=1 Tax=Desulfovermiculus halophilus TaxID=339722 RepID=UPI000488B4D7|nr:type I-C CRISPR-associated protein Cas8c/Csd1 [Desulfovermiculus halophilus]